MEFRLLGPLEATDGEKTLVLAGRKQRALLARLLLDVNRTVSTDRLVDDLWGESPPGSAQKMVQIYVSQLRRVLPDGILRTRPPGYVIEVDPDAVDVLRFERLRTEGDVARAAGDPASASDRFREALALWRGEPLAEFQEPFAQAEAARLEELYLVAVEARIDADLDLGRASELVAELDGLVAKHPLREGLRAQQMLALYHSGRQAEALAGYNAFRTLLSDELGLEPSERLRDLERRILRQDPDLRIQIAPTRSVVAATPVVQYVSSGDVSIAYQVIGEGPVDIVLVHGWVCSFQPGWEWPPLASFYRSLSSMGRLIVFDKRGTGLSDRVSGIASLEERMDDVRAVMDAVGSTRAHLLGISEGGPMVTLFAATYPERTAGVVLMGSFARRLWAPDYPIGDRDYPWWAIPTAETWGMPIARLFVDERVPSRSGDDEAYRWYASYLTRGASPGAAAQLATMNLEIDVRHVLPSVHVPALVLFREGEYMSEPSRYLGDRIPGARVVALPGSDHLPWEGDQARVLREIEQFVQSAQGEREPESVLATVLVVEADGTAEACDAVRADVARFRGTELALTEDTLVASFDGPARAIRCAATLLGLARSVGRPARAGLHTGEQELGTDLLGGIPVLVASGLKERADHGEILVSSTVRDLVAGSGLAFSEREREPLRVPGVQGEWRVHAHEGPTA